jgi:predicted dehydrogenase/D-arabinose 1-dehydrogenase-like Zn-dependent alcohol dehydrogenase
MHQIIQNIRNGKLKVIQVPDPAVKPNHVLVANAFSVISAGTEKTMIDLGKKSLLGKAKERPDQVRRVLEKWRNEGFLNTLSQVREKLDEPMAMGYSSAGVVLACGQGIQEFKPGDQVASNGPHAGVVCVPKHLCANIPEGVGLDQAAFTVLGAIALQGIRLSQVGIGETVLVIGLGLIGQLSVALLKANGCRIIGTDLESKKCELALRMGAEVAMPGMKASDVMDLTHGLGADAVLITASTKSDGPVELAGESVRKKGRVVAVGAVGLNLPRRPYYFKEAEFVVSCSYGPGRYDPDYEERGLDYPAAYVRWTEQRNMQAVLHLMASGALNVSPLISHRFKIEEAELAYDLIEKGKEPYMGILLEYPEAPSSTRRVELKPPTSNLKPPASTSIGVLGAGNFARMTLLPTLKKSGNLRLRTICSAGGLSAIYSGEKLGFEIATSDEDEVLRDPEIDTVFVLTRHNQHASQVIKALQAGKHVFTEKPLCLTIQELEEIENCYSAFRNPHSAMPLLMVGFNRRFSPAARKIKDFFSDVSSPLTVSIRFNAGAIPSDHWTQDEKEGGGRIVGETCHAIDLATYLTGSLPVRVFAESVGGVNAPSITDDQSFITLRHGNGSVSNIAYWAGGDKAFPKERVEVAGGGKIAVIEDFREVVMCANGKIKKTRFSGQNKGHREEIEAFVRALDAREPSPIIWDEIYAVTLASILAVRSIREGIPFDLSNSITASASDNASKIL